MSHSIPATIVNNYSSTVYQAIQYTNRLGKGVKPFFVFDGGSHLPPNSDAKIEEVHARAHVDRPQDKIRVDTVLSVFDQKGDGYRRIPTRPTSSAPC